MWRCPYARIPLLACLLAWALLLSGCARPPAPPPAPPAPPVSADSLKPLPVPGKGDMVLILAPHPDDETLACAGLIRQSLRAGARVIVVEVTMGDAGYSNGRDKRWKPADYIRLGQNRAAEVQAAMKKLGVPARDLIFLGYPDAGLDGMRNKYHDRRYTSRFTGVSASPYAESFTPQAAYTGASVVGDLVRLARLHRPTHIVFPHPQDTHPDHAALTEFMREADLASPPHVLRYLVHHPGFPDPRGLHLDATLFPPAGTVDGFSEWMRLPLTDEDLRVKHEALLLFKSQTLVPNRLSELESFARKNELFDRPAD